MGSANIYIEWFEDLVVENVSNEIVDYITASVAAAIGIKQKVYQYQKLIKNKLKILMRLCTGHYRLRLPQLEHPEEILFIVVDPKSLICHHPIPEVASKHPLYYNGYICRRYWHASQNRSTINSYAQQRCHLSPVY